MWTTSGQLWTVVDNRLGHCRTLRGEFWTLIVLKRTMQSNQFKEQFFSQLYDEHIDKVYRFVFFKVSNEALAQDITSETFTRLWKEIVNDKEVKSPSGFLFRVAKNMIIDHYRAKDQNPANLDNLDNILVDQKEDVLKAIVQNDEMKAVRVALDQLNEDSRLAVSLYYIEQQPYSEVAKALNRSQGATRVLVSRGMKQLREILEA
ncbi:MAG: RNA polymerase sigma factor [Candidatus Paceibacterota bacterium]